MFRTWMHSRTSSPMTPIGERGGVMSFFLIYTKVHSSQLAAIELRFNELAIMIIFCVRLVAP